MSPKYLSELFENIDKWLHSSDTDNLVFYVTEKPLVDFFVTSYKANYEYRRYAYIIKLNRIDLLSINF